MSTTTEPAQRIDLTGQGPHLRYVEILTDAGVVRVNTNLVSTRTGQQVVNVEIEPVTNRSRGTGVWDSNVSRVFASDRITVTLTRQEDPEEGKR